MSSIIRDNIPHGQLKSLKKRIKKSQISIVGAIITKHLRYAMIVTTCGAAQFDPNLTTPKMGVRIISMTCAWTCGQPAVVGSALSKKPGENRRFDRFIGL